MHKETFQIAVTRRERVPLPNGGFTTQALPSTTETVTVEVDFWALAKALGPKAALNKGGKAVEAGGAVVVKHNR